MEIDCISAEVVHAAIQIHQDLGPGLLESVYELVLAGVLVQAGLNVDRQVPINVEYRGMRFEKAFIADLIVEGQLVVEVKSLERLAAVHAKQLQTYLRLLEQPVGLLLNFGGATMKEGIKRLVNGYRPPQSPSATPRLRAK
jgi:GxxExxY protein